MQDAGYIFGAYAVIWMVIFGYIIAILSRQTKLRREIQLLKNGLKDRHQGAGALDQIGPPR